MLRQIAHLDAHHRLAIGLGVAAVAYVCSQPFVIWPTQILLMYVAYALTYNVLAWLSMSYLRPHEALKTYKLQDSSRLILLTFVVAAAVASLFAVIFFLRPVKQMASEPGSAQAHLPIYVVLSILTVLSSWTLVHTLFTLRYAHTYYAGPKAGGLNFPDTSQPGYADFAYVAFGIGMTSQVADISPTNERFRRLILMHSLLSFGFNTLIVALSINIVSGLL